MNLFGYVIQSADLWIMATAAACGVASGVLGCFLVLRRMSLLGDAISHAILPGLAIAFILSGTRQPIIMLIGAAVSGLLTALLTSLLNKHARINEDAAMGVVFSSLFAVGVILITWVARQVDLDPGCVLYGLLEFVPLDTVPILGFEIPRAFVWLFCMCIINIGLIILFYKELKIVAFDPYLATSMGISAALVHYALMSLVAATAVASFEAVGSVLVVTMLVGPAATAYLLTDKLSRLLIYSAMLAIVAAIVGYLLAVYWNTSVAGMVSVIVTANFILAALLAPRYGYFSKIVRQTKLTIRICREDILGMLYRWHEHANKAKHPSPNRKMLIQATGHGTLTHLALQLMLLKKSIQLEAHGGFILTDFGMQLARGIVRSHRLWESYLAKYLQLPLDHLHEPSHRVEHFITPQVKDYLSKDIATKLDPHGKVIPNGADDDTTKRS